MKRRCLFVVMLLLFVPNLLLASTVVSVKEFSDAISRNPNSISEYDVKYIVNNSNEQELFLLNNAIQYINSNSIRRSDIKTYYFPLCLDLISKWVSYSEMLQTISEGNNFVYDYFFNQNEKTIGREINRHYDTYKIILATIASLPLKYMEAPVLNGNLRYLEEMLFHKTNYMDKIDPLPKYLIDKVDNCCHYHTGERLNDLINTIEAHVNDIDYLLSNSETILRYSTYTSNVISTLKMIAPISTVYVMENKQNDFFDLYVSIMRERYGEDFVRKITPILSYQLKGLLDSDEERYFFSYKDSLLIEGKSYANYLPHQCPEKYHKEEGFEEYSNKFYELLCFVFEILQSQQDINNQLPNVIYNKVGCDNRNDLIKLYTYETLKRFYKNVDLDNLNKVEDLYSFLKNSYELPLFETVLVAEVYLYINAKKARDLLEETSFIDWVDEQITDSTNVSYESLYMISFAAHVYSSLYNELRYDRVNKYIKFVETHIDKVIGPKDDIIYEIAAALSDMGDHKKSNSWILKIDLKNSGYRIDALWLMMNNHYCIGSTSDRKEVLQIASQLEDLSPVLNVQFINTLMEEGLKNKYKEYVNKFSQSISSAFNQFIYMDTDDQDWSYRLHKYKIRNALYDGYMTLSLMDFVKDKNYSFYLPYYSGALYNWALASKGALLRSFKQSQQIISERMSKKDLLYYKKALEYEMEDYETDNLSHRVDAFVSEQSKRILLNYIRTDSTYKAPGFDYCKVKDALTNNETAIEVLSLSSDTYIALILRKQWEFPICIDLDISKVKNIYECLWKPIEKYISEGEKIYFSLDGIFNTINVELASDSIGKCMADKYKLYRVSTTQNLCNELYLSNVSNAVLYGNLRYSGEASDNRGAIISHAWGELIETKEEIYSIKKILEERGVNCMIFEGDNGNKSSFYKQSGSNIDILHLATHGFYWPHKEHEGVEYPPMKRAGIVLAGSDLDYYYRKKSGTIFANEISNMDLNEIKLVVLSACETAIGDLQEDGIIGLQRGLKQAGVGTIIMSLKKVNSKTTMILMVEFYKSLAKGLNVRDAFRDAQKKTATKCFNNDWKEFIILD